MSIAMADPLRRILPVAPRYPADPAALREAGRVMAAGCRFLIARAGGTPAPARPWPAQLRTRRAGNCLKELDRFLTVLMRECTRDAALPPGAPAMLSGPEILRLRAIGRLRLAACGTATPGPAGRLQRDLAIAGATPAPRHTQAGAELEISDAALGTIAEFYLAIAGRLCVRFAGPAAKP